MGYWEPIGAAALIVAPIMAAVAWLVRKAVILLTGGSGKPSWRKIWLPVAILVAVIMFLSSSWFSAANTVIFVAPVVKALAPNVTADAAMNLNFIIRRCAHLGIYGLLFLLAYNGPLRRRSRALALLVCVVVAMIDEGHQAMEPDRSGLFSDVVLDFGGALIANFADLLVARRFLSPATQTLRGDHLAPARDAEISQ